jgi:hypothetical protein
MKLKKLEKNLSSKGKSEKDIFWLYTTEEMNNISAFFFLSAGYLPIGRCTNFSKSKSETDQYLVAVYYINSNQDRDRFLETLKIQNGKIKASVLMTNGVRFVYTFKAVQGNWKKALNGEKNMEDDFVIIKKELDES